ncbi:hypothetical protein GW17_00049025 [Ensete ventricosum]|nr:hypothetical protein GW17_00049025 [Ensete ventricosum]
MQLLSNRVRSKERQGGEAVAVRRCTMAARRCSNKGCSWKRLWQQGQQRQGRRQRRREERPTSGEQQGSNATIGVSKGGGWHCGQTMTTGNRGRGLGGCCDREGGAWRLVAMAVAGEEGGGYRDAAGCRRRGEEGEEDGG